MTADLKIYADFISNEALNEGLPKELREYNFINGINALSENFSNFISKLNFFSKEDQNPTFTKEQKEFVKLIKTLNYLDIVKLKLQNIVGINTTYTNFTSNIELLMEEFTGLEDQLLNPLSNYLAKLVKLENQKYDSNKFYLIINSYAEPITVKFKQMTSSIQVTPSNSISYGDAFDRNQQWELLFDNINRIDKITDKFNNDKILKKIENISTYLDTINSQVKEKKYVNVSKEVATSIAQGVYTCAGLLEMYSLTRYNYSKLLEDIKRNMEIIKSLN